MKTLIALVTFVLTLGTAYAGQIDAAKLRGYLEVPVSITFGGNLTSLFHPQRIPSSPKVEIVRLKKQLAGTPSDAPVHYRIGELYNILNMMEGGDRYSNEAVKHYYQAAEQYQALLQDKPSDPSLLLGYVKARRRSAHGEKDDLFRFVMECPTDSGEDEAQLEDTLRRIIAADPAAWEARFELAQVLENRVTSALMSGMAMESMKGQEIPGIGEIPQGLSTEDAERLLKEAAEQRDLAVKSAPNEPEPHIRRFASRFGMAMMRAVFVGPTGQPLLKDKAAMIKLAKEVLNPSDLRKAWQLDRTNATVLHSLVFVEILNTFLEESSRRPIEELFRGVEAEDPAKRTWNLISAPARIRLSRYEGYIRDIVREHPMDVWAAYEALGIMRAFQGRGREAERAFMIAAQLNPHAPLSYLALFAARSSESRGEDKLTCWIPLLEMKTRLSESPTDLAALAALYAGSDRLDKAEGLVRRALRLDPESFAAHHLLGVVLLKRQSDPQEAIKHLEKALTLKSDDASDQARLNLGIAYAIAGNLDKSQAELRKVGDKSAFYERTQSVLEELGFRTGHVIYSLDEYVLKASDGTLSKCPSGEKIGSFTAPAGSVIVAWPGGVEHILPPGVRVDPPDAPESDYFAGRVAIITPDGAKVIGAEGSTMEILTEPRTYGNSR